MYTYSNTDNPISQSLSTWKWRHQPPLLQHHLLPDLDSDLDLSLPPSPKQPHIEPEKLTVVTGVNVDVADLANALTNSEKYKFYCNHFTPTVNYKFPPEHGHNFLAGYLTINWLVYQ